MARKIEVQIVGDSKSLEQAFARSAKSANRFNREVGQMSRGAAAGSGAFQSFGRSVAFSSGAFLGGAGAIAVIKDAVSATSDLAEQTSKTQVVFGRSAAGIEAWSKTTAQALGLSQRQALAAASSFGALFKPIGLIGPAAAEQSQALTTLGSDLASFYNTDVQSALDAIRSGLVGESEPLRQYGILLSETRVQQEAMTETGKKNAKALTTQEKALARITLIFRDSTVAQGDFQRTSGHLANQLKIAKANLEELEVELATGLVPTLTGAVKWTNTLVNAFGRLQKSDRLGHFGFLKDNLFKQVGDEIERGKKLGKMLGLIKEQQKALQVAGPTGPAGPVGRQTVLVPPGLQGPTAGDVQIAKRTAAQRNDFFDAMIGRRLGRVDDAPLRAQLGLLGRIGALITKRIAATKDVTRKLNLEDQLLQIGRQRKDVRAQLAQAFTDGLQFNVDKAGLTATMADDIAALNALLAGIRKRMLLEGATLDLRQQELGVQQQLAAIASQQAAQQAAQAAQQAARAKAAREAAKALAEQQAQTRMDWAQLALEKAQATKGLGDDIKALKRIIALIRQQIRLTGRTVDLARQLFEAQQQLKDVRNQGRGARRGGGGGGGGAWSPTSTAGTELTLPLRRMPSAPPPQARPSGPSSGFGGPVTIHTVNMYGVQDVLDMERQLQKRAMARPQTRRGPV